MVRCEQCEFDGVDSHVQRLFNRQVRAPVPFYDPQGRFHEHAGHHEEAFACDKGHKWLRTRRGGRPCPHCPEGEAQDFRPEFPRDAQCEDIDFEELARKKAERAEREALLHWYGGGGALDGVLQMCNHPAYDPKNPPDLATLRRIKKDHDDYLEHHELIVWANNSADRNVLEELELPFALPEDGNMGELSLDQLRQLKGAYDKWHEDHPPLSEEIKDVALEAVEVVAEALEGADDMLAELV